MYIREVKTKNKKTGNIYIKHRLVASRVTESGPRQDVIMELGRLEIPKSQWKQLAFAIESMLDGQEIMPVSIDSDIDRLARDFVSSKRIAEQKNSPQGQGRAGKDMATVDLGSVATGQTRSLGGEIVCQWAWERLGFEDKLAACGFGKQAAALARAVVFGKLIEPGSEMSTYSWFKNRSALPEFPGANIEPAGKDAFYAIGDRLYEAKDKLEGLLYESERELYPSEGVTVFLYDLTNTYMEGHALGNDLAARGHCKSKRTDCPLVTLAMVVDGDGMPIASNIYKGNQSEPETMEGMIKRIEALAHGRQISFIKPTIAMDRGIATHENVECLKANGYPYVVIRREDGSEEHRQVFEEERGTFTLASEGRRSIYGDDNKVFVRKELQANEGICKVLCISEGKARKEQAIDARKDNRFLEAVRLLDNSIQNGRIKSRAKIDARLDKIKSRHRSAAECYTLEVLEADGGAVSGISAARKTDVQGKLFGCYVIETTHTGLDDVSIWNLYMTLTKVESAFRALKSELGMRPVYHQNAGRTAAHLFIGVLAYHMLAVIERELGKNGDSREWATVRKVLSTHTRCTVSMKDADGSTHHIRVSGTPEGSHREIYAMLGARDPLKRIHSQIGKN